MDELEIGVFLNWGEEEYVVFRLFWLGESEKRGMETGENRVRQFAAK